MCSVGYVRQRLLKYHSSVGKFYHVINATMLQHMILDVIRHIVLIPGLQQE